MQDLKNIWIFGPSASGKTTLAKMFISKLRDISQPCMLFDGDEVRLIFDQKLGYDKKSRQKQTLRTKKLSKFAAHQNVIPVVAIIHPFEEDRKKCRKELSGYFEVYLKCDMEELINRDSKKLYLPAIKGEKRNVIGVDIPFDEPEAPDLIIDTKLNNPQECLELLWAATYGPHES